MRTTSLLLLLGSLMAVPATQAADASDWLNRLAEADRQNSFQGTFVYERNGSFSTHEIWHRVESDGAVRERLQTDDGGQMVTVVGEVPLGTAERVALSIRPEAAAQK